MSTSALVGALLLVVASGAASARGHVAGETLAFVSLPFGKGEIYTISVEDGTQHRLTRNKIQDRTPAWSPDGTKIAFGREGGVYVMGADGYGQRLLRRTSYLPPYIAWSPDGRHIAYVDVFQHDEHIYVMRADGSDVRRVTPLEGEGGDCCGYASPTWSPDGRHILFSGIPDKSGGVWVARAGGGDVHRLAESGASPAWSPDGKKIAYVGGRADIYTMNADGSGTRRLTQTRAFELFPAWSPDGKTIAFARDRNAPVWELDVINADGSHERRLIRRSRVAPQPAWSPDGSLIAYNAGLGRRSEVYVMKPDGGSAQRLTSNFADNLAPTWRPSAR